MAGPPTTTTTTTTTYTCRLCRHVLFTDQDLATHAQGSQRIARRKLGPGSLSAQAHNQPCTSYFLNEAAMETLEWVKKTAGTRVAPTYLRRHPPTHPPTHTAVNAEEGIEGKLTCPNKTCGGRLGGFNWSGSQCSCGSWVAPAIQIIVSKVDRKGREETEGLVVVDFMSRQREAMEEKVGGGGGGGRGGEQEEVEVGK